MKVKKAAKGSSLGMKSVKAGFDKNPGVTRADVIVAAKGQAKKGIKVKKAQFGKLIGKAVKAGVKKSVPKKITDGEISTAFKLSERDRMKKMFQKLDAAEEAAKKTPKQKMGGKTKKCRYGCK